MCGGTRFDPQHDQIIFFLKVTELFLLTNFVSDKIDFKAQFMIVKIKELKVTVPDVLNSFRMK